MLEPSPWLLSILQHPEKSLETITNYFSLPATHLTLYGLFMFFEEVLEVEGWREMGDNLWGPIYTVKTGHYR